jgi:DUF1365 family protein
MSMPMSRAGVGTGLEGAAAACRRSPETPALPGSALYRGVVVHGRRIRPVHAFRYRLFMLLLDLDALPDLDRRLRLFGHNRGRPVSYRDADHLGDPSRSTRDNVEAFLRDGGLEVPGGPIFVLTHGRVFGYVFNPVSFFYCYDREGRLAAVVAEVNNTFGERHPYRLPVRDRAYVWHEKKLMHVSPFFSLDGTYRFELPPPGERLEARIDLAHGGETVLASHLSLERRSLTDASLLGALARYPLMTASVIAAIHWQALRLWLKGARVWTKPPYDPEAARRRPA